MGGCLTHSYSTEPKHRRPENYGSCPDCTKAWDGYLRRQAWKRSERKTSKKLGTVRNPGSGASTPDNPGDSVKRGLIAEFFSHHEHRYRKTWDVPGWWREVLAEAKIGSPLLTLAKPSERGTVAVLDFDHLVKLLEELKDLRQTLGGFSPQNGLVTGGQRP